MEFFICNLVRVVQSPRFYMSLFLTLLCMFLGNLLAFSGIYKIEGLSIFFAASSIRGFSPISLVAALICTLPYSSQIIEDAESHFLTAQLCRISKKRYLAIVGSTAIISSFLVFFLPYLLLLGINLLVTPYQEIYIGDYSGALKELFDSNQLLYSLVTTLWYGVWGAVFSIFGLASALLVKKKLGAIFIPIAYMMVGGILWAILGLSYLEPVTTLALGYQKDISLSLVSAHLAFILFVSCLVVYGTFFLHSEDYV